MSAYDRHLASVRAEAEQHPDRANTLLAYVEKCRRAEKEGGRFRLGQSRTLHRNPRCVGRDGLIIEPLTSVEWRETAHFVCLRCGR